MELTVLKDIVVIFALSTLVNLVFTKFRIPTIAGYLLTGIIAGPHLLSLVNNVRNIELLAEIGVVFLLFTIGMEFSLQHLMKIRRIVFLGGFIQVTVTAGVFYAASRFFGISREGALLFGFLMALSSSALVLKILQERSELTSNYGRTVLGILIFQDLLLAPLLLFANLLSQKEVAVTSEIINMALKVVLLILFVFIGNRWLLPKMLHFIALTRNQELFMMSILFFCLAVALLTFKLGMSLAFGAFLAGLMISESEYSHNAFGNLVPFKDTFTSFFFVSIGLLLDLNFIAANYQLVIASVLLVIIIKTFIAGGTGFILGHTFRGTVLVGFALSQVGEFSFILAKVGLDNRIIDNFYYKLFLAVAVITMGLAPFLMRVSLPLANTLMKLPLPDFLVKGLFPLKEIGIPDIKNHLVIIGKDASAMKLSAMADLYDQKHVSIIFDPALARDRIRKGDLVVYGDAVNEPILMKAHVDKADIVAISVGNLIPCMAIIEKIRHLNQNAFIMARTSHIQDIEQLYHLGADQVLPEKLEIAIDFFNRILLKKLYPQKEINRILSHVRSQSLGDFNSKDIPRKQSILDELSNISISAIEVEEGSQVDGKSLVGIGLRKKTGVTLLAIRRGSEIIGHPTPKTILKHDDIAYVIGNPDQIGQAYELFSA